MSVPRYPNNAPNCLANSVFPEPGRPTKHKSFPKTWSWAKADNVAMCCGVSIALGNSDCNADNEADGADGPAGADSVTVLPEIAFTNLDET